jgi:hypothetical protein
MLAERLQPPVDLEHLMISAGRRLVTPERRSVTPEVAGSSPVAPVKKALQIAQFSS